MFIYPEKAFFNRVVPKSKLYANVKLPRSLKDKFVSQILEIVWKYKLSPETTNLAARDGYSEIQVFEIVLKDPALGHEVLGIIDKAIPYPIIFHLRYNQQTKSVVAYKRPAQDGSGAWVLEDYFETDWTDCETPAAPLPIALDIRALYEQIIFALIKLTRRDGESLQLIVERTKQIKKCSRELQALEAKISSEKQFNRKVALKAQIREINGQIAQLTKE